MSDSLERAKRYYYRHREKVLQKSREKAKVFRANHPLFSTYLGMMRRCGVYKSKNNSHWKHSYMERGITVCEEWRRFANFESWAQTNGWKKGLQLDRIDNDKGYSPDNCRFVTPMENGWNKRNNRMVLYKGEMMPFSKAYLMSGCKVSKNAIYLRVWHGIPFETAITIPSMKITDCKRDWHGRTMKMLPA